MKRQDAFDSRCLRIILKTKWWERRHNIDFHELREQPYASTLLMRNHLKWFGHMMRRGNESPLANVWLGPYICLWQKKAMMAMTVIWWNTTNAPAYGEITYTQIQNSYSEVTLMSATSVNTPLSQPWKTLTTKVINSTINITMIFSRRFIR